MTGASVLRGAVSDASAAADAGGSAFAGWLTPVKLGLILWAALSVAAIVAGWQAIMTLDLFDTDDAMRMAQVRDLLAGQSWWDLTQYRLNPAGGGVTMHWSRIVDAPLAAGILLLQPLVGQAMAERIVMTLWPPLLGAALAAACATGYRSLPERRIAWVAPLFLILCGYIVFQFRPLRVDHHGWQILLAMLIMGQALRPATWRTGLWAGTSAALLLAISIEGLPVAALFAGLAALRWALHGRAADRARLCGYMAALAGGAILFQFLTRGPLGLTARWCDSLSAPYLAALGVAGAATLAVAWADPRQRMHRFLLLAGAAALAAGALLATAPQCARGPFAALDPIVVRYWYAMILEGQPIWVSPIRSAIYALVPLLMGLAGAGLAWRGSDDAAARRSWATVIVALVGASLLSLLVIRSVATAHLFAIPGCAWLGLRAWDGARAVSAAGPRILASVLTAFTLPLFASMAVAVPLGWAFPALQVDENDAAGATPLAEACLDRATIAALDDLPPTTVMTPLDLGPSLIFWTDHRVVATGHHRNAKAMADTIRAFVGDPARAEALVRGQEATLILFCPTANDFKRYRGARSDALAAQLYARRAPAWLEPLDIGGTTALSVWRVKPR